MMKKISRMAVAVAAVAVLISSLAGCSADSSAPAPSDAVDVLFINEIMSSNSIFAPAADGRCYDWVELYNASDAAVDLAGYYLTNNINFPDRCSLRGFSVPAGGYLLIYCSGLDMVDEAGNLHASFKVSSRGKTLMLSQGNGTVIDQVNIPASPENVSYGRDQDGSDEYVWFSSPTPGARNGGSKSDSPDTLEYTDNGVRISEFLVKNTYTNYDGDGEYHSWVELYNPNDTEADLSGYYLTDNISKPCKWAFPDGTVIPAGGYLLVWCSGKDTTGPSGELHTSFGLGKADECVALVTSQGRPCHVVDIPPNAAANVSCGFLPGSDEPVFFSRPTPGGPNTTSSFPLTDIVYPDINNGVLISETLAASSANGREAPYPADFIELYNSTGADVSLLGYTLSTRPGRDSVFFSFPDIRLPSGGYLVIWCTGYDSGPATDRLTSQKKLNNGGTDLYLADAAGRVVDYFYTGKQTYGTSRGRVGRDLGTSVVFDTPTPGAPNADAYSASYAPMPALSLPGGYVDAGTTVTIAVPEGCTVYYTTNGKEPSPRSTPYTDGQIITIGKTTVLRAIATKPGCLPSQFISETYFVAELHDIPIISLAADPYELFDWNAGLLVDGPNMSAEPPHHGANYWSMRERVVHIEYYVEGAKAVEFEAGMLVFGQYARKEPQKGLRLSLREKYGANEVTYPFFEDPVWPHVTFGSLLLRPGGQDWSRAKLRDELVPTIVRGQMDIDFMDAAPCALYINGEYWGLYYIKEKLNADYIHRRYGYEYGNFDLIKAQGMYESIPAQYGTIDAYKKLNDFVSANDLSVKENYDKFCEMADVQSLINFWVVETFFVNPDTGNIRCYKSYDDGSKWRWMIYDFDWAMTKSTWQSNLIEEYLLQPPGHGANHGFSNLMMRKLLRNDEFRDLFISTYCHHLNSTFNPKRTIPIMERMADRIKSEIPRQYRRWNEPSVETWENQMAFIRQFLTEKPDMAISQLKASFGLSDSEMQAYLKANP